MIVFLFGDREVGRVSLSGGEGIGKVLFELGFDSLSDLKHYSVKDGQLFLDKLVEEFHGAYFRAESRAA